MEINRKNILFATGCFVLLIAIILLGYTLFFVRAEYYDEMKLVKSGYFQMGRDDGQSRESPRHTVQVDSFWIDQFEVTNEKYVDYLNSAIDAGLIEVSDDFVRFVENPDVRLAPLYTDISPWSKLQFYNGQFSVITGFDQYPVAVTWYGATAYCEAARKRLPTEAEWQYAAIGGHLSQGKELVINYPYMYSGSNDADSVAWHRNNSFSAHPVGQLNPNELELFDLSGNFREWVSDWFDPNYYEISPLTNPQGPEEPTGSKVMCGGSYQEYSACLYDDENVEIELGIDPDCVRVTKRDYG